MSQIPNTFITTSHNLLHEKIPSQLQGRLFVPDDDFYEEYFNENDPAVALEKIAGKIAKWLGIRIENCNFGFFHPREVATKLGNDTAGLYIERPETILIHQKYKQDPTSIAAILAHEMMHLYLFRNNVVLPDPAENELLTDLATVETGLGILVLNGFKRVHHWWITIIAVLAGWFLSGQRESSFGYFESRSYTRLLAEYIRIEQISENRFADALLPRARKLLSQHIPLSKTIDKKIFVRAIEQHNRRYFILQLLLVVVILTALWKAGVLSTIWQQVSGKNCDVPLIVLKQQIEQKNSHLETLLKNEDTATYNQTITEIRELIERYEKLRQDCEKG